jgi:hypothetical protein
MKLLRIVAASLLVVTMSTSAFAEDFSSSIAKAIQDQIRENDRAPRQKGYLWGGAGLVAVGLTTAIYGFMHDATDYPVAGEATASNNTLGFSGLAVAAGGGLLLFLGQRQPRGAPSLTLGPGRMTISKQLSW